MIFYAVDRLTRERTAFMLVGSHTSTVRVGGTPAIKPGCAGCRDRDGARSAETACPAPVPQDRQARAEGIAQPSQPPDPSDTSEPS